MKDLLTFLDDRILYLNLFWFYLYCNKIYIHTVSIRIQSFIAYEISFSKLSE